MGIAVGCAVVGAADGNIVGVNVGNSVAIAVGLVVDNHGLKLGTIVGRISCICKNLVGFKVGVDDGARVGVKVATTLGAEVGAFRTVGCAVGAAVGQMSIAQW